MVRKTKNKPGLVGVSFNEFLLIFCTILVVWDFPYAHIFTYYYTYAIMIYRADVLYMHVRSSVYLYNILSARVSDSRLYGYTRQVLPAKPLF